MEKEYVIGQLEKTIADEKYYFSSDKEKQIDKLNEMQKMMEFLRKQELTEGEKKIVSKSATFMTVLRRFFK